jgi:hypothetical protein
VIQPLRPQGAVVGDQEQHRFLEPPHVEPPGSRQSLPVLEERLRVVRRTRRDRTLTRGWPCRCHRTERPRW